MKYFLMITAALVGSFAHASHTTCSSPSLYYSNVRHDFGTAPPPGTETGSLTILAKGHLLENITYTAGHGGFTIAKHGVSFAGPRVVLAKTGNQVAGAIVYTNTAVLSTQAPYPIEELLRSSVVCEETWAFVP